MFDHVTIRVADRLASERFYDTVLGVLGVARSFANEDYSEWGALVVAQADRADPPTRRVHLGFAAPSREHVDDFWRTGTEAGYHDDGPPGPRPQYRDDYYGSFLLDPDGNSIEAVHHGAIAKTAVIDHIWMRVADVAAARRFYELVAPYGGFTPRDDDDPVGFEGRGGSFSLVAGPPTAHLHIAFGTPTTRSSTLFTAMRSTRAIAATARRASGRSTTRATTPRSCSTPTATTSSSSTTTADR